MPNITDGAMKSYQTTVVEVIVGVLLLHITVVTKVKFGSLRLGYSRIFL